jgi:hypothetical protein
MAKIYEPLRKKRDYYRECLVTATLASLNRVCTRPSIFVRGLLNVAGSLNVAGLRPLLCKEQGAINPFAGARISSVDLGKRRTPSGPPLLPGNGPEYTYIISYAVRCHGATQRKYQLPAGATSHCN